MSASDKQNLDVESKSIQLSERENILSDRSFEQFKAALGIKDPRQEKTLDDEIESITDVFAMSQGLHFRVGVRFISRTDSNVGAVFDRLGQALPPPYAGASVSIVEQNYITKGRQHSLAHGVALALVGCVR